jgi:hypothetical protein
MTNMSKESTEKIALIAKRNNETEEIAALNIVHILYWVKRNTKGTP